MLTCTNLHISFIFVEYNPIKTTSGPDKCQVSSGIAPTWDFWSWNKKSQHATSAPDSKVPGKPVDDDVSAIMDIDDCPVKPCISAEVLHELHLFKTRRGISSRCQSRRNCCNIISLISWRITELHLLAGRLCNGIHVFTPSNYEYFLCPLKKSLDISKERHLADPNIFIKPSARESSQCNAC